MATSDEVKAMDAGAVEVRRLMKLAVDWAKEQEEALFAEYRLTDAEKAIIKSIHTQQAQAQLWLTTWRSWAERGLDDKGFPYRMGHYLQVGKDLASAFALHMKETANQAVFTLTLNQSVKDVEDAAENAGNKVKGLVDFLGSTKGKLLVGGGLLLLTVGAVYLATKGSPVALARRALRSKVLEAATALEPAP